MFPEATPPPKVIIDLERPCEGCLLIPESRFEEVGGVAGNLKDGGGISSCCKKDASEDMDNLDGELEDL